MKHLLSILFFLYSLSAAAQTGGFKIEWHEQEKRQESVVSIVSSLENEKTLMFLAWQAPFPNVQTAFYIDDEGSSTPVSIKQRSEKKYLLLSRKKSSLKFVLEDSSEKIISYELVSGGSNLQLSANCRNLGFKVKSSTSTLNLPAMITCQAKGKNIEQVTFSSLEEAEWFGSDAFENSGKGERWKNFAFKDIVTLGIWQMSWGEGDSKITGKVLIPKANRKPTPPPPKPALTFLIGASYLTGTAEKTSTSGSFGGVLIPASLRYQKDSSWWYLGASYELLVLPTSKSAAGSSGLSGILISAGAEYKFATNWFLGAQLGYLSRSISAPSVGVTISAEAPRAALDFSYRSDQRQYGFQFSAAQTSSEGKFSENTLGVFYQSPLLFGKDIRFDLSSHTSKITNQTNEVSSRWNTFGISFGF